MLLLVATEFPPNASGGGPAVVRQMLKGWPTENLFWWSCLAEKDQRFGQKVASHYVATIPGRLYPNKRFAGIRTKLMETFWAARAARHLRHTISSVNPDVIWTIPHLWSIPPLAAVLPGRKINFHTTVQDYPDSVAQIAKFGASTCSRLAKQSDILYASATTRDATSHPMLEDLAKRTGKAGSQMIHAGIEREDFEWLEQKKEPGTADIRIAHAGTIIVEKEFAMFVSALNHIRGQIPSPLTLHLFGYHSYKNRSWFDSSWMFEHGNLDESALKSELRKCTWGFSPMALDDNDPRYNRFSFPTKFISYLAAGLPVIIMGHPESSVMKMATHYCVGPNIGSADIQQIVAELNSQLSIEAPYQKFKDQISDCARDEFDAQRMRTTLRHSFASCLG